MEIIIAIIGLVIAAVGTWFTYKQAVNAKSLPVPLGPLPSGDAQTPLPRPILHNLPSRDPFVGREHELQRIFDGFASHVSLIAIEGLGGMGKTAVAKEIAWRCIDSQGDEGIPTFEAIVWIEDKDGRLHLSDILDTVARVLDCLFIFSLPTADKAVGIKKVLRERSCLVIVDGFETVVDPQVREFIQAIPAPSRALITSRERLLPGAWAVLVKKMDPGDALLFVQNEANRLGLHTLETSESDVVSEVYDATGGNPFAIRLSLAAVRNSGLSLQDTLDRLRSAAEGDVFDVIFDRDWNDLLRRDWDSKAILMTMTFFSTTASWEALHAGSNVYGENARLAIKRLIEASLIDVDDSLQHSKQRFSLHSLTRYFVRRQLSSVPDVGASIELRLLQFYLAYTEERRDTYAGAHRITELDSERDNIFRFVQAAAERSGSDERMAEAVVRFASALSAFLWGRGYWNTAVQVLDKAIAAASKLNDSLSKATFLCAKGRIHLWRGDLPSAQACADASHQALTSHQDRSALIVPKRLDAQIATRLGDYERAEKLLLDVLAFAPNTADDHGRAATLIELGIVAERQFRHKDARERFEEALRLDVQLGTVEGQAVSLSHLAKSVFTLGDAETARSLFERGLMLATQVSRLSTAGRCQVGLARIDLERKSYSSAITLAGEASDSFERLGMHDMVDEARAVALAARQANPTETL